MPYLKEEQIAKLGLKSYGKNLLISDKVTFYRPNRISLGNNIKIDDFVVLGNHITIGDYVHISLGCSLLASDDGEIIMEDFSGFAPRVHAFTGSDDYSGEFMTGACIPKEYRGTYSKPLYIGQNSIVGSMSCIMPGAHIREGVAVGSSSLVMRPTKPFGIYFGNPAKRMAERNKNLLKLKNEFLSKFKNNNGTFS